MELKSKHKHIQSHGFFKGEVTEKSHKNLLATKL